MARMRTIYNSIKDIHPETRNWKVKVLVVEKTMPRTSTQSVNTYQRLILIVKEVRNKNLIIGENTILIPTFWCYSQFGPYILVTVNLVPIIFNLHLIWSLLLI